MDVQSAAMIGAGVAVLTGLGAGFGIPLATGKTSEAIARQPKHPGKSPEPSSSASPSPRRPQSTVSSSRFF
jgi:hypothetical protein